MRATSPLPGVLGAALLSCAGCPKQTPRAERTSDPVPSRKPSQPKEVKDKTRTAASRPAPRPIHAMFRGGPQRQGRTAHVIPTSPPAIVSSPALDHAGNVYVGTLGSAVVSVDPRGKVRWRRPVGGRVFASPTLADGRVVVGTDADELLALDSANGQVVWRFALGPCVTGPGLGPDSVRCDADTSPLAGPDGTIYVGGDALYALTPAGKLRWRADLGGHLFSSPAMGGAGTLYIGTQANTVVAVDPTGAKRWEFSGKGDFDATPALVDDTTLVIGCDDGTLYALNTASGAQRWAVRTWRPIRSSAAVDPARNLVLVGTDGGRLLAVESSTGQVRWRYSTGGAIRSSPVVDEQGTVVVGSQDDHVYALDSTGKLLWKVHLGGDVDSSIAVAPGGTLYVGADDGGLYALH
jgi:outer membrane protein assembly factor BamB